MASKIKKTPVYPGKLVTGFKQACLITGRNPLHRPKVSHLLVNDRQRAIAQYELDVMAEAQNINDSFVPNPTDSNQWKYTWWPLIAKDTSKKPKHASGFVFSDSRCDLWTASTNVGPRLSFISVKRSMEFGEKFWKHYFDIWFNPLPKSKKK